ncbi:MAG: hypothetical protein US95_C0063G0013 [Candidatus Woesebacteria bacterium GW2011_GWB1_38_5]|uniref:Uncharacterized protein n=1 Tax=Candidatus Woesebacteria bacterium GW2011_GWB1_38_5 TaxID=1618568 RepID=A0A0G0JYW1_9BACT|nr:MAG: hypothetical protein US95_C0063G0013 [Candidatus Woesebacteria bacterium GW2011_GWB1_38_5]
MRPRKNLLASEHYAFGSQGRLAGFEGCRIVPFGNNAEKVRKIAS